MYKGFYDLTSAMLTQTRNLDVVGNNMSNTATTGYKADRYADTTFDEVMRSRVGNKQKAPQALGTTTSYITALDEVYTDHSQGGLEQTGLPFDLVKTVRLRHRRGRIFCRSKCGRAGIYEKRLVYAGQSGVSLSCRTRARAGAKWTAHLSWNRSYHYFS